MSVQVGQTVAWEKQPGMRIRESGNRLSVVYVTQQLNGYPTAESVALEKGAACPITGYTTLVIEDFSIEQYGVAGVWKVNIEFAEPDSAAVILLNEYNREDSIIDRPIEEATNYKTCWNYHLAKKSEEAASSFTGWNTATTTVIASAYADRFRWLKEPSELPDGWEICQAPIKPGRETFKDVSIAVIHKRRFLTESSATTSAAESPVIATPGRTYGITGGNWLKIPSGVYPDGDFWVVENRYEHDPQGWDTDIYS